MSEHTVKAFDAELEVLRRGIAEMGGVAERMLVDSIHSLVRRDPELAQRTIATDAKLDNAQAEIEDHGIRVIGRRQPIAVDLREIVAAMRIAGDLERIGDLAKNVAKRVQAITGQSLLPKAIVGLQHLAELVQVQLKDVLDANARNDMQAALAVRNGDGAIDALYTSLFRELLTYMMEDPRNITFCTHLLFCAKNIERIGDHSTNVAETIYYRITGKTLANERPKQDASADIVRTVGANGK